MGKDREEKNGNRIGRLSNDTLSYYRRVADTLCEGFSNSDEKEIFLENVFKQLAHEALAVSQNQTVSRIIETLLHEANDEQAATVMSEFSKDWETAVTDRFASHVTQTLLLKLRTLLYADSGSEEPAVRTMFRELYRFLLNNVAVHMQHTYTSHILRVLLEILGGVTVADQIIKSKVALQNSDAKQKARPESKKQATPPCEFQQCLTEMTTKIINMNKFKDHAKNNLSNPVIQTVLLVLKAVDSKAAKKACKSVITNTDMFVKTESDQVAEFLQCQIGSRLAEQVLMVAPDKLYDRILREHLAGGLLKLALHPITNFILQRLIQGTRNKEQFELILKELGDHLEDILAHNHVGVVAALADGALKQDTKQDKLIKILMKAFHCHKPEERQIKVVPLLATLTTYDVFYKVKDEENSSDSDSDQETEEVSIPMVSKVNLHGSVLLQKLLRFTNPRLLVTSLLDMRPAELRNVACDPCGSHVLDAFISSPTVGEKSRASLLSKLKGLYLELATNKHGSRTLENLWSASNVTQRAGIAEELVRHEDRLRSDTFGRFIHRNFALYHYRHRQQEWRDIQTGNIKKRKLFQDLIDTKQGGKKSKSEDDVDNDEGIGLQSEEEQGISTDSSTLKKKKKKSHGESHQKKKNVK